MKLHTYTHTHTQTRDRSNKMGMNQEEKYLRVLCDLFKGIRIRASNEYYNCRIITDYFISITVVFTIYL